MVRIPLPIEKLIDEFQKHLRNSFDPVNALNKAIHSLGQQYLIVVDQVILSGFPLGSMQVRGKYRDVVFATFKGKTYVKKLTVPKDPKSQAQVSHRTRFKQAAQSWAKLSPEEKQTYNFRARDLHMNGFNLFVKERFASS